MLGEVFDATKASAALTERGYQILPERWSEQGCREIIAFIDGWAGAAEWNYNGTEKRIWKSHTFSPAVAQFQRYAAGIASGLAGQPIDCRDILAIRNQEISDDPALTGGRWHLDSLRRQVKIFLFLTDVDERSGPLELIEGTNARSFRTVSAIKGKLLSPMALLQNERRYQRLEDRWIANVEKSYTRHALTCRAGTIAIVDTSCIHRARPCLEGVRYALTAYYDRFRYWGDARQKSAQ